MTFEIDLHSTIAVIRISKDLTAESITELATYLTDNMARVTGPALVLDFKGCNLIEQPFFRLAAQTSQALRKIGKKFLSINMAPKLLGQLKAAGLDTSLEAVASLDEAVKLYAKKAPAPKLNVEFVNPFIEAALKTLKIQCSIEATAGKPYVKTPEKQMDIAIAGVIGLTSQAFRGSIALCFPAPTFLAIMNNMIGEKKETIDKDLEDGAGELLNIIFGQAKITLNQMNYGIEKAIPTVVRGASIEVKHVSSTPTIVCPFETPAGPFSVEIVVEA